MDYNQDAILRISKERMLFNKDGGSTIKKVAEQMGISMDIVCEDVSYMLTYDGVLRSSEGDILYYLSEEELDEEEKNFCCSSENEPADERMSPGEFKRVKENSRKLDALQEKYEKGEIDSKQFRDEIVNVLMDGDAILYCGDEDAFKIVMSYAEYEEFSQFLQHQGIEDRKENRLEILRTKNVFQMTEKERKLSEKLQDMIDLNKTISFDYGKEKKKTIVKPIGIEFDSDTGLSVLVDENGGRYRLDRIAGDGKKSIQTASDEEKDNKKKAKSGRKPRITHVKVKIIEYTNTKNPYTGLREKVIADLNRRYAGRPGYNAEEHVTKEPEKREGVRTWIYEDDISDVSRFCSWIYSYGKSMIVLEPQKIRDRIKESYEKRKKYYEEDIKK